MASSYITRGGRTTKKTTVLTYFNKPKRKYTRRNPIVKPKRKYTKRTSIVKNVSKIKPVKRLNNKKVKRVKRKQFPQVIRNSVSSRQNWTCGCCKELFLECIIIDHMLPLCFGGSNDISNLQALCPQCDKFKTGYLDYKVLKNIANDGLVTPTQVAELQHEYFNKIMGGNSNTKNNQLTLSKKNIQKCDGKIMQIDFNGVKITIQA